ncbi:MAG: hypothetical protein HYX74_10085 [Acidobacteria bacterium]|nr:hypothetical protein [Acidobacteriota bacterium]
MKCPHCDFDGRRMDLHAHLVEQHPEQIRIYVDETLGRMVFELTCPICGEGARQPLKKSAAVLEEYRHEIRLVAFDLLLYHLEEKHDVGQVFRPDGGVS